jgi:hypothetical protein
MSKRTLAPTTPRRPFTEEVRRQILEECAAEGGWPLVRLDKFVSGGYACGHGFTNAASANEQHVDNYLKEFITVLAPLIPHFDLANLLNVVLSHRNGSPTRDRMLSAKTVATMAPYLIIVKETLEEAGYDVSLDAYEFRDLWAQKGDEEILFCLGVRDEGVYLGTGDGYHRSHNAGLLSYSEHDIKKLPEALAEINAGVFTDAE